MMRSSQFHNNLTKLVAVAVIIIIVVVVVVDDVIVNTIYSLLKFNFLSITM